MLIKLYAIKDKVAEEFGPPFMAKNDAIAGRMARDLLKNTPYPLDYTLEMIGNYDLSNGKLSQLEIIPIDWKINKLEEVNEPSL